jgi:alpha-soluble NSF attachment protein
LTKFPRQKAKMSSSSKADLYKAEGNKALNRTTIFGFGKAQKYEDAADSFKKAGIAYKLANQYQSAGDVYLQSADAYINVDSQSEAINQIVEAAGCYKRINPESAITAYERAIELYNDGGRFGMSARYYKEIAEIYESMHNAQGALTNYELAAEFYNNDNKKSNANQCLIKVLIFNLFLNKL